MTATLTADEPITTAPSTATEHPRAPAGSAIIFYDGVCALCNWAVRFVLRRDRDERYYFAPLQSDLAARVLGRHGEDPGVLDAMFLVRGYRQVDEEMLKGSRAAYALLRDLGGIWKVLAMLDVLPRPLNDFGYRLVARTRYALFGRYDSCPVPAPETRHLFLDP